MATIYYPSSSSLYTRIIAGGLTELNVNVAPDTIFVLSGSSNFTTSLVPQLLLTASTYDITSSWSNNISPTTAYRVTSSFYNIYSSSFTASSVDDGKFIIVNNNAVVNILLPSSLPVSFNAMFFQSGSSNFVFTASGASLLNKYNQVSSSAQYGVVSVIRLPGGNFLLGGDTA